MILGADGDFRLEGEADKACFAEVAGLGLDALSDMESAEAAIAALHAGGGISVDYQSLPEAVFTTILPQFRESARPEERRAMEHATSDHAKHPGRRFEADSASKAQSLGAERR